MAKHGKKAVKVAEASTFEFTVEEEVIEEEEIVDEIEPPAEDAIVFETFATETSATETSATESTEQQRAYMGIEIGESQDGVEVATSFPETPAQKAGIQAGDVIFRIGASTITSLDELRAAMKPLQPGNEVKVGIMREGRPQTFTVTLGTEAELKKVVRPSVPARSSVRPSPVDPALPQAVDAMPETAPTAPEVVLPTVTREALAQPESADERAGDQLSLGGAQVRSWVEHGDSQEVGISSDGELEELLGRAVGGVHFVDVVTEIETETRRERRPVLLEGRGDLRRRVDELEREIAELSRVIGELRRELDRRSVR